MNLHPRKWRVTERGSILIWMALLMVFILAFVALGIDGAKLMTTRTQLQNAADAGALAGASQIDAATGDIDQAKATSVAQATAANNKAFIGGPKPVLDAVVSFPEASQCQVDVTRSGGTAIVTHLAQVVGVKTLTANATATAGLSKPTCVSGVVPLGVGNSDPSFTYTTGEEYNLIESIGTGNYQYLNFGSLEGSCTSGPCGGNLGAQELNCELKYGYGCCLPIGQTVDVKTGQDVGPVKDAINDFRFDGDTWRYSYPTTWKNAYLDYQANKGNGMRKVIVPLVTFSAGPGGTKTATVKGFASFFLKRKLTKLGSLGWVYSGEYVQSEVIGEGTGGNGTVYTIKLVK